MRPSSEKAYADIVSGLRGLGYIDSLLVERYSFPDWFAPTRPERCIAAAAFGQTPVSYESALIGVARSNGLQGPKLIDECRALGAPIILEVGKTDIREWAVTAAAGDHALLATYPPEGVSDLFVSRSADWKPAELLRAKNIGDFRWAPQLSLFTGLIPELEGEIQERLEPLLRDALSATKKAYSATGGTPEPRHLFKLVFWLLTAKVFRDRRVKGFESLGQNVDADDLLSRVARQYRESVPKLLNREARQTAAERIWIDMDFRNLSVEVLSQMWSTALMDARTKKRLGIHRTSRTIVRYIIDRIPFNYVGDDKRIVLEPCCGSGVFLIGAMNALRRDQLYGMGSQERHDYFVRHLVGIEKDPFGIEISRLALTLADFPNPGGWNIEEGDVFDPGVLKPWLQQAGVVLCNPPFGKFDADERKKYELTSPRKPVELLNRVLKYLHPSGVLGFVLPRAILDGRGYALVRRKLAERFASIEITTLPDRAFDADSESGLLIAKDPIPHDKCRVIYRKVADNDQAWMDFVRTHTVPITAVAQRAFDEAENSLALPEFPQLWEYLRTHRTLGKHVTIGRGIEFNKPLDKDGNRARLVRDTPAERYLRGVPPRAKFNVFETPETKYLSARPEDQRRNGYLNLWDKPKVIINKSTRSRGHWRIAAFPDAEGLACFGTFNGVWPNDDTLDIWVVSAILNSPLANAFVTTREGKVDITFETLEEIPIPFFTTAEKDRIRSLVVAYRRLIKSESATASQCTRALMEIDAAVLSAYRLQPRLEHELLEWFRGPKHKRRARFAFGDFLPEGTQGFFSLSDRLSPAFAEATAGALRKRLASG